MAFFELAPIYRWGGYADHLKPDNSIIAGFTIEFKGPYSITPGLALEEQEQQTFERLRSLASSPYGTVVEVVCQNLVFRVGWDPRELEKMANATMTRLHRAAEGYARIQDARPAQGVPEGFHQHAMAPHDE